MGYFSKYLKGYGIPYGIPGTPFQGLINKCYLTENLVSAGLPQPFCRFTCVIENYFSHFSTKYYVLGTQKSHLNETVLLSTKTYVKTDGYENIENFTINFLFIFHLCNQRQQKQMDRKCQNHKPTHGTARKRQKHNSNMAAIGLSQVTSDIR